MNLIEIVNKYQNEILDKSILVEYGLFFNEVAENRCKFVIDELEELEELNCVIRKIVVEDKNAEIYVNTYGIDFEEENIYIYADSLWINTMLEVKEIYDFFEDFHKIEPTDIVSLVEDETIDGTVALVILANGIEENYRSFIKKRKLSKIKSLYWD
jgi:predicted amidohydrolase